MNGNDTFLDIRDAHLRVTSGNVYASTFNLDQIDIVMSSNTASTVNFNNPTKAFNTVSNIEVGTANLFVDTTTTRVGVGTNAPAYTLDVHGSANVGVITATDINVTGNLAVLGTSTIVDTDNLRVKDPIIELGKDNTASPPVVDLGLVMTRPSGSSNVGIIFDESTDTLEIGYTQGNASDSTITMDSTPLSVNVNGDLSVTSNLEVGTANLFVDTVNSRVGVGTTSPIGLLSIVRDTIVAGVNTYQRGMFYKDGKLQITPPDLYNGYPLDGDFLTTSRYETDGSTDYTAAALGVAYDTVSGSKSALYFKTASSASSLTEKVRITGDGNVGIGTTNPTRNLHVFHPTYGIHRSIYWSEKPGNPATQNPIQMGYLGSSDPSHASGAIGLFKNTYEGSSEDETVRIQANGISWFKGGNVGIGTSSPGAPLSILTTSGNHLRLHYNDVYYNTLERDTSGNFNIRASDGVGGINTQMTILPNGNTTINGTISYSTKQATHQKNQSLNYTTANVGQYIKSVMISTDGIAHVHVTGLWKLDAFDPTGTNGTDTEAIYFNLRKNSTEITASAVGHRMAKLGNANDTDQWRPLVLSWSGAVLSGDQISVYTSGVENSFSMNELDLNVLVV